MACSWVVFHVTDRCQLNCDHCLRDPARRPSDISVELVRSVLDQAKAVYASDHVGFTGGEPTLHPRFFDLVDSVVDRGMTWHMVSNGQRFGEVLELLDARPERICAATAIDFSIDGADETTHDGVRGAGSYRALMQAISLCRFREIPFVLQMTLNARNVAQIEALALMGAQLGATRISFGVTQPTGTFLDRSLYLSAADLRMAHDRIQRVAASLTTLVTANEGFYRPQTFHNCEPFRSEILHVDPSGNLTLCCQHSGIPGDGSRSDILANLHDTPLIEAHRRFLDLVHETWRARIAFIAEGEVGEWDRFTCNWCLKHFGKPHWTESGACGPGARRERWKGAWAPEARKGERERAGATSSPSLSERARRDPSP